MQAKVSQRNIVNMKAVHLHVFWVCRALFSVAIVSVRWEPFNIARLATWPTYSIASVIQCANKEKWRKALSDNAGTLAKTFSTTLVYVCNKCMRLKIERKIRSLCVTKDKS